MDLPLHSFAAVLADTLIPGDERFPSASAASAVDRFEKRITELRGPKHLEGIRDALSLNGAAFAECDENARTAAIAAFERERHPDFEEMLAVLYLSYYESALVTDAIKGLGLTYHNPPQPHGYRMSPFDSGNPLEGPSHGRGHYVPTHEVRRVSLAGLDHLADPVSHP